MKRMKDLRLHGMVIIALLVVMVSCGKKVEVSLSPVSVDFTPEGGTVEVALTSNGDWQVESSYDWLSVSPISGKGNATLVVSAAANGGNQVREAQVKVSTKNNEALLAVKQGFSEEPFLRVEPTEIHCDRLGGMFDVAVVSNIAWTISSLPEGITTSVNSGSGNANLTVTVSPIEEEVSGREVNVVFAGGNLLASLVIKQISTSNYDVTVNPSQLSFGYEGGRSLVNVGCESRWTALPGVDWITLSATSGDGDAEIEVTVAESDVLLPREGHIEFNSSVGSTTVVYVHQEAAPDPHFLTVTPLEITFGKEGGTETLTIGCDVEWSIDMETDWASLSATTGTGNAMVMLSVEPNNFVEPRDFSFIVNSGNLSQRVVVQQSPGDVPIQVVLSPDTLSIPYMGSTSVQLDVTSNTSWYLVASDWISNLPSGQTQGDATVNLIVDNNSNPSPRYGFVKAMHNAQVMDEIVVVQEGKPDLLEVDITEMEVRPEGMEFSFHITSNQAWTISWDVQWLRVTPTSGFGNGDALVTVDAMESTRPREAIITVKADSGRMVTVTVIQHL